MRKDTIRCQENAKLLRYAKEKARDERMRVIKAKADRARGFTFIPDSISVKVDWFLQTISKTDNI